MEPLGPFTPPVKREKLNRIFSATKYFMEWYTMFSSVFLVFTLDDQGRKNFFTADKLGLPYVYC